MTLIERIEAAEGPDNALDVLVEIELFRPNSVYSAVRCNSAGTKLIYLDRAGNEVTCWAEDWTLGSRKDETLAILKARKAGAK